MNSPALAYFGLICIKQNLEPEFCLSCIASCKPLRTIRILTGSHQSLLRCYLYFLMKKKYYSDCSPSSYTSLGLKTTWLVIALAGSVLQIVWDDEMHTCTSSQSTFKLIKREVGLLC